MSFDGNVAAVTGGAMGIGKAICENFASLGADVAIADIAIEDAEATAAEIGEEYGVRMAEKSYALDRLGQPEDITNGAVFVASDAADWITGRR